MTCEELIACVAEMKPDERTRLCALLADYFPPPRPVFSPPDPIREGELKDLLKRATAAPLDITRVGSFPLEYKQLGPQDVVAEVDRLAYAIGVLRGESRFQALRQLKEADPAVYVLVRDRLGALTGRDEQALLASKHVDVLVGQRPGDAAVEGEALARERAAADQLRARWEDKGTNSSRQISVADGLKAIGLDFEDARRAMPSEEESGAGEAEKMRKKLARRHAAEDGDPGPSVPPTGVAEGMAAAADAARKYDFARIDAMLESEAARIRERQGPRPAYETSCLPAPIRELFDGDRLAEGLMRLAELMRARAAIGASYCQASLTLGGVTLPVGRWHDYYEEVFRHRLEAVPTGSGVALLPLDIDTRRKVLTGDFEETGRIYGADLVVTKHEILPDGTEHMVLEGSGPTAEDSIARIEAEARDAGVLDRLLGAQFAYRDDATRVRKLRAELTRLKDEKQAAISSGPPVACPGCPPGPEGAEGPRLGLVPGLKVMVREDVFLRLQDLWDADQEKLGAANPSLKPVSPEGEIDLVCPDGSVTALLPTQDVARPCRVPLEWGEYALIWTATKVARPVGPPPSSRELTRVLLTESAFLDVQDRWEARREEFNERGILRPISPDGTLDADQRPEDPNLLAVLLPTRHPDRPYRVRVAPSECIFPD